MNKLRNQVAGNSSSPANHNGNGAGDPDPLPAPAAGSAALLGNDHLIDQVRRIIAETPEIRAEKVAPLQEALDAGAYEVDVRRLANILITKLILEP